MEETEEPNKRQWLPAWGLIQLIRDEGHGLPTVVNLNTEKSSEIVKTGFYGLYQLVSFAGVSVLGCFLGYLVYNEGKNLVERLF